MSVRVRVKNFQSIEDAEVLIDRFTVVTGANNSGKTALVRAIQGVFSNTPGDAYVRHGKDFFSVNLDFGDGQAVTWEKGPRLKPTYKVGGRALHSGRVVPDEVTAMGVQPIAIGSAQIWPQIAPQFTGQVFLLDLPGSSVAEAVADVERVGKLTQALRLAESDKRSASSELRTRRKDVESLDADVRRLDGLDIVVGLVDTIGLIIDEAQGMLNELNFLERERGRLIEAEALIAQYKGVRDVPIPSIERCAEIDTIRVRLQEIHRLRERLVGAQESARVLAGFREVDVPESPVAAQEVRDQLAMTRGFASRVAAARAASTLARSFASVMVGVKLDSERFAGGTRVRRACDAIRDVRGRLANVQEEVARLRNELCSRQETLRSAEQEVQEILDVRACPTCGQIVRAHQELGCVSL